MSIYEYDEKLHEKTMMEIGREEGFSEGHASGLAEGHASGLAEGDTRRLLLQIIKKIKKSESPLQTASELEEDINTIQPLYNLVLQFAPEYDIDTILKNISNHS